MARDRRLLVSGINVVTHPHSPENYVALFRSLMKMRRAVPCRGPQHLMLGEMVSLKRNDPLSGLFGRIYRFDHIDPDLPWFNVARHDRATAEEMEKVAIPEDLKPNLVTFEFLFFPRGHVLYFVSGWSNHKLSPGALSGMLSSLCAVEEIAEKFGQVELTVLPDKQQLARIFAMHRLAHLKIDVVRPNPDDNNDAEEQVLERLGRQGVKRIVQDMTAVRGESIRPDEDTVTLAKVAEKNGRVDAIGYTNAGQRREESTVNIPWKESVNYDPDLQVGTDVFVEFTSALGHGR